MTYEITKETALRAVKDEKEQIINVVNEYFEFKENFIKNMKTELSVEDWEELMFLNNKMRKITRKLSNTFDMEEMCTFKWNKMLIEKLGDEDE